jgi:glycosyltransferase involved in cell wall biosynthesis
MHRHRVLVISHGHPDLAAGGGEIAAHNLFGAYKKHPAVEAAWFLGRIDRGSPPQGTIGRYRADEYLWEQGTGENCKTVAGSYFPKFEEFLRALQPTLVHAHHYLHLGVESLRAVKRIAPGAQLMLTLHEFLAICAHHGQMVKRGSLRLCSEASLDACHQCFPERSREDLWLRKQYIFGHFRSVDRFIAPSEFLRQRYIAWGIAPERIAVIENGQADGKPLPPRELKDGEARNRFAFFGQVTQFKGVDVLLQGLNAMPADARRRIIVEIHAAHLEKQSGPLRERIERLAAPLIEQGMLRWAGAYNPNELRDRMAQIDWVLVPSIWWENSPLVIQEAFAHGRPVICSGIGGMAEKVRHGKDGIHVAAGNPFAWADTLLRAAEDARLWESLRAGIRRPMTHAACAEAHLALISGDTEPRAAAARQPDSFA